MTVASHQGPMCTWRRQEYSTEKAVTEMKYRVLWGQEREPMGPANLCLSCVCVCVCFEVWEEKEEKDGYNF